MSDEERCRFQTAMRDRLDIVLTLYERVENVYPGTLLLTTSSRADRYKMPLLWSLEPSSSPSSKSSSS